MSLRPYMVTPPFVGGPSHPLISALACNAALQHCQSRISQASGWDLMDAVGQHARISHFSAERTSFVTTHAKDHIPTASS